MIDAEAILAHPPVEVDYRYGPRDVMLHALGTGLVTDPLNLDQLRFAYDDFSDPLLVLPTFAIVLGWIDMVRDPRSRNTALGLDGDQVVVGQAGITLFRALGPSGEGKSRSYFADVVDKGPGRGALVCVRRDVLDPLGALLATVDTWLFVRGAGGFGGPSQGGLPRIALPTRPADHTVELETQPQLALLYRLCLGDHNAVHADPGHAARTGFDRPILHGLASLSASIHCAISGMTGSLSKHARRLRSAQATMARPVFPGERLRIEAWGEGADVLFRTSAMGRRQVVVDAGRLTLGPEGFE